MPNAYRKQDQLIQTFISSNRAVLDDPLAAPTDTRTQCRSSPSDLSGGGDNCKTVIRWRHDAIAAAELDAATDSDATSASRCFVFVVVD
jgi:hypothetical protein